MENQNLENQEQINHIQPEMVEYDQAEWVFQFDDDEPIVFAWSNNSDKEPGEVTITLKANSLSSVFFASSDLKKKFRLFARPMSDQTKMALKQE